ncbi:MAG: hypothetical protein IPJ88_07830 [Myxococcales bacterium]|nr:MAG: hypothetical protein IPJ88_07830 [Myxococcales bacterium]
MAQDAEAEHDEELSRLSDLPGAQQWEERFAALAAQGKASLEQIDNDLEQLALGIDLESLAQASEHRVAAAPSRVSVVPGSSDDLASLQADDRPSLIEHDEISAAIEYAAELKNAQSEIPARASSWPLPRVSDVPTAQEGHGLDLELEDSFAGQPEDEQALYVAEPMLQAEDLQHNEPDDDLSSLLANIPSPTVAPGLTPIGAQDLGFSPDSTKIIEDEVRLEELEEDDSLFADSEDEEHEILIDYGSAETSVPDSIINESDDLLATDLQASSSAIHASQPLTPDDFFSLEPNIGDTLAEDPSSDMGFSEDSFPIHAKALAFSAPPNLPQTSSPPAEATELEPERFDSFELEAVNDSVLPQTPVPSKEEELEALIRADEELPALDDGLSKMASLQDILIEESAELPSSDAASKLPKLPAPPKNLRGMFAPPPPARAVTLEPGALKSDYPGTEVMSTKSIQAIAAAHDTQENKEEFFNLDVDESMLDEASVLSDASAEQAALKHMSESQDWAEATSADELDISDETDVEEVSEQDEDSSSGFFGRLFKKK